jgi:hypothetical protein
MDIAATATMATVDLIVRFIIEPFFLLSSGSFLRHA